MTGPAVRPDDTSVSLPPLHRILTPDEFHQAKQLSPDALRANPFPLLPPAAPKDAVAQIASRTPQGQGPATGTQLTGKAKAASDAFQAVAEHPIKAAAIALTATNPAVGAIATGLMGHDVAAYAGQKAAELTMDPESKKIAEADPERISGQTAALDVGFLAAPILGGKAIKAFMASDSPLATAVKGHMATVADSWKQIFNAAGRSSEAAQAAGILRATTGEMAGQYEQAAFKLDEFRRAIDPLPDAQKLQFIDAIEGGQHQANAEFQAPADAIRKTLDDTRDAIRNLGTGKLDHFIENYFPHIWEDPDRAANAFKSASESAEAAATTDPNVERSAFLHGYQQGDQHGSITSPRRVNPYREDSPAHAAWEKGYDESFNPLETGSGLPSGVKLTPNGDLLTPTDPAEIGGVDRSGGFRRLYSATDAADKYYPRAADAAVTSPDALQQAKIATGGKRPMEGSRAFLKERTIPTTREGMEMGLVPVSTNPVDLTLLKLREMQRYLMAHQSLNEMKDAGLVKFVRAGEAPPDGYQRIDDKIATVFGPREGAVNLPEGANIDPSDVGVPGMRIMGQYHAPEPVARVVNNYLSPGLRGNALFDAYRGLGNKLNQAQLGLSAFHLGFTSMDASVSRVALGVEKLASGDIASGIGEIASAPAAPVTNALFGRKIRAAYLDPEGAHDPQIMAIANAVKEAGGRVRQDSFYAGSAIDKMVQSWRAGEYGQATKLSLPALLEAPSKLLMEHIVPMQKLGVFGDMAKKVMAELPEDASLTERRAALAKAWDSVDNRMGQVVYDNLFWNKTVKDLAMASVRSVGWNLGTIRELGGGVSDIAGMAANAVKNEGMGASEAAMTHRAAYVMALPITVGMYGAIYQMLRTGEPPSEMKDYFYPKTGEVDADGNPERVQLPSYAKDIAAYMGHPWETVKHKIAPLPNMVYEMLQNQDYYGDEIRNADDPLVKQIQQEAAYVGKEALPFSVTNMMEGNKRGDQSTPTKLGNWFGVTPAPRQEVRSPAQNEIADILSTRKVTGSTPEDADARKTRSDLLSAMRGGDSNEIQSAVTDAIERHQLTAPDVVKLLKKAGTSPAAEKFKRLTLPQAIDVFQKANPDEQAKFANALIAKVSRSGKSAPGGGMVVPE